MNVMAMVLVLLVFLLAGLAGLLCWQKGSLAIVACAAAAIVFSFLKQPNEPIFKFWLVLASVPAAVVLLPKDWESVRVGVGVASAYALLFIFYSVDMDELRRVHFGWVGYIFFDSPLAVLVVFSAVVIVLSPQRLRPMVLLGAAWPIGFRIIWETQFTWSFYFGRLANGFAAVFLILVPVLTALPFIFIMAPWRKKNRRQGRAQRMTSPLDELIAGGDSFIGEDADEEF